MKKILALLLAMILLCNLVACDNNSTDNTNESSAGNTESSTTDTENTTEDTEGTTQTDSTISSNTPSTEDCEHSYYTDGMTDCNGILRYICRNCQHTYEEQTEKYWHEYRHYYAKQPTLTEEGISCTECTKCDHKETEPTGKLTPTDNVYINRLHCFLESDSPLNTELYTWQGKAKGILCNRYPDVISEAELFTKWRCWEYDISNDEIQKIKTTSHYNPSENAFLSYDDGAHPPVLTTYLGYTLNEDGTATAYASIQLRVVTGAVGNYVDSGFCKIQMKYGTPPTNEQRATLHITSIMRVESIPENLTN